MSDLRGLSPFLIPEAKTLNQSFIDCKECNAWSFTRNSPVPGYGLGTNKIMFVGQSPGPYGADETGIPFTKDKSGIRFQEMLKTLGLKFEDCYTTNLVKFCPGWNDLQPEWIEHSRSHLWAEINLMKPRLIVTFGRHAFLNFDPMGQMKHAHGKIAATIYSDDKKPIDVFPIYHFAYYIRKHTLSPELDADIGRLKSILIKIRKKIIDEQTTQSYFTNDGDVQLEDTA